MSDKILETVRKLLAQAESTSNEHERETFNRKASELIATYGIERAKLEATDPGKREPVTSKIVTFNPPYTIDKSALLHVVASSMRCKTVRVVKGNRAHLIGYPSDIERVEIVYSSLLVQQSLGLAVASLYSDSGVDKRTFAKSYFTGFQNAVNKRLRAAEKVAETATGTPGTDLVLADRRDAVERQAARMFDNMRSGKARQVRSNSGYASGHADGSRANLSTGSLGRSNQGSISS